MSPILRPTPGPPSPRAILRLVLRAAFVGVTITAVLYALEGGEYPLHQLNLLRGENSALLERKRELVLSNDSLNVLVDMLESDSVFIERTLRQRYGFIREGEMLVRILE